MPELRELPDPEGTERVRVIIEADGGSRGNPGTAGAGTVVYADDHREVLRRISWIMAKATNNVAEYQGLINGLRAAAELGASDVAVFMDSKLVVEQMSGRWKIKHPDMRTLALQARDLAAGFDAVTYEWVPRAKNAAADELANKAMDAAAKGQPPGELELPGSRPDALSSSGTGVDAAGGGTAATAATAGDTSPTDGGNDRASQPATDTNNPARWSGATSAPTRLLLLRHGQTPMSAAGQYSGQQDPELSDLGHRQAIAAAESLHRRGGIDVVLSSPLRRARDTAAEVATRLDCDVEIHPGLTEMDFGVWDGLTFAEARRRDPELHGKWLTDTAVAPPGGESLQKLHRRVKNLRAELQRDYPGKTILLVTHLTVIKSLIRQALEAGPQLFRRLFLDLASISIVEFYEGDLASATLINDTSHLR